jgi:hypothetical protein
MSRSFRHVTPGRIQIRDGGGCMAVFGLPFFCAGIFLTLAGLRVLPLANAGEVSRLAWPVFVLMGLAFLTVGGALVFGRSWTTLDAAQRTVVKEQGLFVPMRAALYRLDNYTEVILGFEEGDSDSSDRFPISLKSRSGADLQVCSSTQYSEARAWAADIARHLHFEIEDATTDHPVRVSPDHADLPLQSRLRLEDQKVDHVERPSALRSEASQENDGVRIVIPMPRIHPVALALMLTPLAIPLVLVEPLGRFFRQTQRPDAVGWMFLAFLVLIFGFIPVSAALHAFLSSRLGRTIVTVATSGIRIQRRTVWRTKTVASLAAADILDVDYSTTDSVRRSARRSAEQQIRQSRQPMSGPPIVSERTERVLAALQRFAKGRGITVKTRHGLTTFGDGLGDEEIRYLHSVVRLALATSR